MEIISAHNPIYQHDLLVHNTIMVCLEYMTRRGRLFRILSRLDLPKILQLEASVTSFIKQIQWLKQVYIRLCPSYNSEYTVSKVREYMYTGMCHLTTFCLMRDHIYDCGQSPTKRLLIRRSSLPWPAAEDLFTQQRDT